MKKNCNGCRAATNGGRGLRATCQLGYRIQDIYTIKSGSWIEAKPLQECPKPKTVSEFVNASRQLIQPHKP